MGHAHQWRGTMGLFNALTAAVGGLQAQSFAIQNISGNIANSQTLAYKDINTSSLDMVSSASVPSQQVAGGVTAYSVATNNVQGAIQSATVGTDMAINGDGYFIVQPPLTFSGLRRARRHRRRRRRPRGRARAD